MYDSDLLIFRGPVLSREGDIVVGVYYSRSLVEPVSADAELLAGKLVDRRVTVLTGAGASMGGPTDLPSARSLSERLASRFQSGFAANELSGVDAANLLAVADAVARADASGLRVIQQALSEMPFGTAEPNCGHRILALMFAEGCIRVSLTINYDTCVERAGSRLTDVVIEVCRDSLDLQQGGGKGRLIKLHGCASKPSSMRVTSSQLDDPAEWATVEVQRAAATDVLVIVGIGSLAPYMKSAVSKVYQYSPRSESVWIVSPTIDATWDDLLGENNYATKRRSTAEEFFDELLRACMARHLPRLVLEAANLDRAVQTMESGAVSVDTFASAVENTIRSIEGIDVETLVLCLRWGVLSDGEPVPMATGEWGFLNLLVLRDCRVIIVPM